jgi:hypothetical protein
MNVPRLEIYLNESSKLCIAKVDCIGADSRIIIDMDIDELKAHGLEGAASQVGQGIIHILSLWHKKEFETWDIPKMQDDPELGDYGIAQCLIGKSVSGKTGVHVPSIAMLLHQAASRDEDARRFQEESWPVIRARLESFGT